MSLVPLENGHAWFGLQEVAYAPSNWSASSYDSSVLTMAASRPSIAVAPSASHETIALRARYSPPWADVSIIGIAGSSGSGKSSIASAIVKRLNLPWVVILSIVSAKP